MKKKKESNPLKAIRKMHVECMGGLGYWEVQTNMATALWFVG